MKCVFETIGQSPTNVQFSPLNPNLFAISATSVAGAPTQGNGALYVIDHFREDICNPLKPFRVYENARGGLTDVSWSECHDNILWTCSQDGAIQIWDLNSYLESNDEDPLSDFEPSTLPIHVIKSAHESKINSLNWSKLSPSEILSSSADQTIKLWDSSNPRIAKATFSTNSNLPNLVKWSPLIPATFVVLLSDGDLEIRSTNDDNQDKKLSKMKCEIKNKSTRYQSTTCDWSLFDCNLIVTGSNNGLITGHDLRFTKDNLPLFVFQGHKKSITRLIFDPHHSNLIASCSLDGTIKIWNLKNNSNFLLSDHQSLLSDPQADNDLLIQSLNHHSESVTGLSFNPRFKDQLVDCSSDSLVYLYSIHHSPLGDKMEPPATENKSNFESVRPVILTLK